MGRLPGEVLGGTGYPGRTWGGQVTQGGPGGGRLPGEVLGGNRLPREVLGGSGYLRRSWGEQVTEERRKSDPFASLDPLPTC